MNDRICMVAKMRIESVEPSIHTRSERLVMRAVAASSYPADGADEENTFARWTPSARLDISITNPELLGRFRAGRKMYLYFAEVDDGQVPEDREG